MIVVMVEVTDCGVVISNIGDSDGGCGNSETVSGSGDCCSNSGSVGDSDCGGGGWW